MAGQGLYDLELRSWNAAVACGEQAPHCPQCRAVSPYKSALQAVICLGELGWDWSECQDAAMCTHLQHMGDAVLLQQRLVCLCLTA